MAETYSTYHYLTMSRSKFNMKVPYKTSLPFGKWTPIGGVFDVLPGSTIKLDLNNVTRMLTPIAPIMDDISMDVISFFCNWRILFSKTKQFFGENDQVAWTLPEDVKLPHIKLVGLADLDGVYTDDSAQFKEDAYLYLVDGDLNILDSVFKGSLFDYFGLPFVYPNADLLEQLQGIYEGQEITDLISVQAMPFRAVQLVYNEFLRNPDVNDPITDLLYDDQDFSLNLAYFIQIYKNKDNRSNLTYDFWFLPKSVRWKDLYTSLKPAPQRGPAVALPLGGNAPVIAKGALHSMGSGIRLGASLGATSTGVLGIGGTDGNTLMTNDQTGMTTSNPRVVNQSNLEADLSSVTMATVNQIRYQFATQRYYEKLSMAPRYHDYLKIMFGTRPTDGVLQRPQYLGGHHAHINVQQVLQTSETSSTPLGSTGAYSVSGFTDHVFTNSFDEFGIILTFATVRKQHTYCQGLDKYWTKRDMFDIYNPTFAHIGHVPCAKNEIYWQPGNTDVMGYNEAWYEYRFGSGGKVTGLMNPLAPNNLSTFVLTDVFDSAPTLTDNFVFEDPNGLDRALVAGASSTNQFICDFYFKYTISAVMPVYSTPGLIDHF